MSMLDKLLVVGKEVTQQDVDGLNAHFELLLPLLKSVALGNGKSDVVTLAHKRDYALHILDQLENRKEML